MTEPPDFIVEAARQAALSSTCAKSKRGVVLFNQDGAIATEGFNSPPLPFVCTNTPQCRSHCGLVCLHAEQRAIMRMVAKRADYLPNLDLVHVKVERGIVVAGGLPSCLQCSRLTAEVGLRGVWLFESTEFSDEPITDATPGCTCGSRDGARSQKKGRFHVTHGPDCPSMLPFSAWRYYAGITFHQATLATLDLRSLGDVST